MAVTGELQRIKPTVKCSFCKRAVLKLPVMTLASDQSEGELWDEATQFIEEQNWRVWRDGEGKRIAVCPVCVDVTPDLEDAKREIEPFSTRVQCVKCRYRDKIETTYKPQGYDGNDLLMRRCTRCGYVWHEHTADKEHEDVEAVDRTTDGVDRTGRGTDTSVDQRDSAEQDRDYDQ